MELEEGSYYITDGGSVAYVEEANYLRAFGWVYTKGRVWDTSWYNENYRKDGTGGSVRSGSACAHEIRNKIDTENVGKDIVDSIALKANPIKTKE